MTQEDIIRMAREAGFAGGGCAALFRFTALVAAAEREACAKVCDELASNDAGDSSEAMRHCAAAIRERNAQ